MNIHKTEMPPAFFALLSAILFGASTPASKILLGAVGPQLLAGLLYLGSGIGLAVFLVSTNRLDPAKSTQTFRRSDGLWLAGAVVFGGIIAPLILMIGLKSTMASAASLLLNLEGVFTASIAWIAFKEHTDRRIVLGMIAIVLGGVILSWVPGHALVFPVGSLAIVGACLCWALDNNLTRNVSDLDPSLVACIKGLVAGSVNCIIALCTGSTMPALLLVASAAVTGFVSYGISLVLFIKSLRSLGTARTGAYFSTAPFAGALLSVLMLREHVSPNLLVAGALMTVGVILHLTEKHVHEHVHAAVEHGHRHTHDEHHNHEHTGDETRGEPHSHPHSHDELRHSHRHYPDAEHRHDHD